MSDLHLAAKSGSLGDVKRLIKSVHDLNSRNDYGQTALSLAVQQGHTGVVAELLSTEQVVLDSRDVLGSTPLLEAARSNQKETVKLLLDTGRVDPDYKDSDGRTPLSHASQHPFQEELVALLLENDRVDPENRDNDGRTPLFYSVRGKNRDTVQLLLKTGQVSPWTRDNDGRTPFSVAVDSEDQDMIRLLLDYRNTASMSNSSQVSKYTPLTGSRQFRVLLLHPGQDDDPISCSLEVETLWDGATFEALSYVWGGGDPKNRILLDGDSFLVRDNLFDALTRLRNDAQVRRLWVDAICINQDDVLERNSQVRLMTELYSAASKVLVWLGVDDQIASAFKAISEMRANAFRRLGQGHTDSYAKWDNRASYMLQNLYFERAWIFQEVVSSEGATIYCGSSYEDSVSGRRFPITDSLPWEDLTELYHALGEELLQKENPDTYISLIGPLCLAQNQRRSRKGHLFHLLPLLELRRNSKATDPRDKIYALLELSADGEGGRFPVDYRLSVAEVYTNAALFLIQSRKDLRVLSAVQHSEESRSDLPSWVPDWREPWKVKPLVFRPPTRPEVENTDRSLPNVGMMAKLELVTFQRGEFTSIDDTGTSFAAATGRPLELESSDNPAELRLKGTSFAKIRVVINFYNDILKVRSKNSANVVLTHLEKMRFPVRARSKYPETTDTYLFALCETVVADLHELDKPVKPPQKPTFNDFLGRVKLRCKVPGAISARCLFVTDNNYVGLGPATAAPGDEICLLFGGPVPYVVRRSDNHEEFVGECYCHGIMSGEAIKKEDVVEKVYTLR